MTPIEVIAAIGAFAILAKIVFILCCPRVLIDWSRALLRQPELILVVYGLSAVVISYYVFQTIGIVPFMACLLLIAVLLGVSYVPYAQAFSRLVGDFPKTSGEAFAKNWLSILLWTFLACWTLYAVFG